MCRNPGSASHLLSNMMWREDRGRVVPACLCTHTLTQNKNHMLTILKCDFLSVRGSLAFIIDIHGTKLKGIKYSMNCY